MAISGVTDYTNTYDSCLVAIIEDKRQVLNQWTQILFVI